MGALTHRPRPGPSRNVGIPAGLTLVELTVTIAIAGILVMLAIPSLRMLILTQYVRTGAADLHSSFYYARSEAIKRAVSVEVVPVANDWRQGWAVQLADGTVLRRQPALNAQLASIPAAAKIVYRNDGHLAAAPGTLVVTAADNERVAARCVGVDLSGRPTLTTDTDGNAGNGCN